MLGRPWIGLSGDARIVMSVLFKHDLSQVLTIAGGAASQSVQTVSDELGLRAGLVHHSLMMLQF